MLSVTALTTTISASAIAQPLDVPAKSNTSGFSVGLNLNGSAVRSPADFKSEGGGLGVRLSYGLNQSVALYLGIDGAARSIALDAGLLFSYGKFTDAKVSGETFSDSGGDSTWSSRFNLGLRMHFR